jgi:hypothetical protein
MKMAKIRLIDDWWHVLKHAWSIRFVFIAGFFSGLEVIIPMFSDKFSHGTFAIISFLVANLAFISRIVSQKNIGRRKDDGK